MFQLDRFIAEAVTKRPASMFAGDIEANREALSAGEGASRDMKIIEAGEADGIYIANFPIEEMRAYRESEIMGDKYRKPEKYKALVE